MTRLARVMSVVLLAVVVALAGCTSPAQRLSDGNMRKASDLNAQLGAQYLSNGDLALAKEKLDKALRQDPDNVDAHATYALLSMRLNKPDDAREHFETALDERPEDPQLLNNYGTFLCEQGDFEAGIERFLSAAENPLYETPAYAYANAGRCAERAGRTEEAREYLRQALSADGRMGTALYDLASLEYAQGRMTSAKRYIDRYHEVATPAPESLWLAVRIERRLGNARAADEHGKRLLRKYPDSRQAERFLETR